MLPSESPPCAAACKTLPGPLEVQFHETRVSSTGLVLRAGLCLLPPPALPSGSEPGPAFARPLRELLNSLTWQKCNKARLKINERQLDSFLPGQ